MTRARVLSALCLAASAWLTAGSASAELPSFLRKENSHVREGNEHLHKGDAKAALAAYNSAARELPAAPGVSLNRGIALLKQGEYGKARDALLTASEPSAPKNMRADAYEDLALAFYREADGLAAQKKHEDAQKLFREAVDASKRSLRLRPGDPNTAWNLELAARRIREEQQKQKEEDDKKKKQQKDQQKSDQQNSDQKDQGDQQDHKQNQDQPQANNQDQNKPDSDKDQQQQADKQPEPDKGDKNKPEPQKSADAQDQKKQPAPQPQPQPNADKQQKAEQAKQLPPEAEQALDALANSEENFERYRARQRAARERRAPEKDW